VQIRKSAEIISLLSSGEKIEDIEPFSLKWRSKIFPYQVLALSINDIDNDGIDELTLLTDNEVKVLVWDGFCFVERLSAHYVDTARIKRNQSEIRLINKDQSQNNIHISIPDVETSIWKYDKNTLLRCGELPFNLISIFDDSMIVGTLKDNRNYFAGQKIYLVKVSDRTRAEKPIPKDFYSIAVGDVNNDGNPEWIIVDNDNVLRIYSEDMNLIWKSPILLGMGLIISDLDNNGKQEIIATSANPQGKSDALMIFEWDGIDYTKKWESQPINGSIFAMCLGDPNLDGINELVIAIYTQDGTRIEFYTAN
ncbi:MAG: FG-GAP repeat domain-containing protein, partial [Candidatus Poribacteria bacterium]